MSPSPKTYRAHAPSGESYTVSLRIWHPRIDPSQITSSLSLTPRVAWAAGSARPHDVEGAVYDATYWSTTFPNASSAELPTFLDDATRKLAPHAAFFRELVATGGRIEYFVGLFLDRSAGEVFPHGLLGKMAALGITLALDIYGPEATDPALGSNDGEAAPLD